MFRPIFPALVTLALFAATTLTTPVFAASISTHVLDLAKGIGGRGLSVGLEAKGGEGLSRFEIFRHPSEGWGLCGWAQEMPACAGMTGEKTMDIGGRRVSAA